MDKDEFTVVSEAATQSVKCFGKGNALTLVLFCLFALTEERVCLCWELENNIVAFLT